MMMILSRIWNAVQVLLPVFLVVVVRKLPQRFLGVGLLKLEGVDCGVVVDTVVAWVVLFRHVLFLFLLLLPLPLRVLLLLLLRIVAIPLLVLHVAEMQRLQNETVEGETRHGAPTRWPALRQPDRWRRRRL